MMITRVDAFLCDLEVERKRTDVIQAFIKQETILVDVTIDAGLTDRGYAYTIGTGDHAVRQLLRTDLCPAFVGEDAHRIEGLWQ